MFVCCGGDCVCRCVVEVTVLVCCGGDCVGVLWR